MFLSDDEPITIINPYYFLDIIVVILIISPHCKSVITTYFTVVTMLLHKFLNS